MSPLQITVTIVALVALPVILRATWLASRCSAGWRVWILSVIRKFYVGLMIDWQANRTCPFPRGEAAIIVGNHTSPVDPILMWNAHNRDWPKHQMSVIGFMVAREYYNQRSPIGWICRVMESIPVKRTGQDMRAVRSALTRLKSGKWLGIFPEGGINQTPEDGLRPANTGVGYLALKSGVPVYPVWITDAPRSTSMVKCFLMRSRVRITYGEPIHFSPPECRLTTEMLQDATDRIMQSLESLAHDRGVESGRSGTEKGS